MKARIQLLLLFAVLLVVVTAQVQPAATNAAEGLPPEAWLPFIARQWLFVDPQNRQASLNFYHDVYLASEGISAGWTGNHGSCDAGTTSQAFRDAVALRINYFRAMTGIPAIITLDATFNAKAQQAALMMSVNRQLSHTPDPSWLCYTADGAEAADNSNLFLGVYGPDAISGYIHDPGSGNYFVGHRRWILHPPT